LSHYQADYNANCGLYNHSIYISDRLNYVLSQVLKLFIKISEMIIRHHSLITYKTPDSDALSYVNGRALSKHNNGTVRTPQFKLQLHGARWCVPGTRATACNS